MKSLPQKLSLIVAASAGFAACAFALTRSVEYKPYGVPDSRRSEYDTILTRLEQQSHLAGQLEGRAKPVFAAAVTSHDFDLVEPGDVVSHTMEIRNDGNQQLTIEVQNTSSKRLNCELDTKVLAPHASAKARLSWNAGIKPGSYEHGLTLKTNDPLQKEVVLKIRGKVMHDFTLPKSVTFEPSDPVTRTEASFVVHSKRWEDIEVLNVESDLESFDWHADPVSIADAGLSDPSIKSAWRVRVWTAALNYGKFDGQIMVSLGANGGAQQSTRPIPYSGRVRAPIAFLSPNIDRRNGLDIGTVESGKQHSFHLVVRVRGDLYREIEVLDVEPKILTASITPLAAEGNYRLTLTINADAPMTVFNVAEKHGYVQVGDPNYQKFSSWFPLYGAVVTVGK